MLKNFLQSITGSNLRNKVLLYFIVLSAIPILALGGVALYVIDFSHRRDVSVMELGLINKKVEELNKFLADTLGILELRVGFSQKSEIELSQQNFLLDGLLEENKAFAEVSLINLQGVETAKKSREASMQDLIDVSLLPKFKEPAGGKNFISDIYYTLSGPFVTMSAPVLNRNGEIIQILSADVDLSSIKRSVEAELMGSLGGLILLDKEGRFVAGKNQNFSSGKDFSGVERIKRIAKGEILDGLDSRDRYRSFFDSSPVVGVGKKVSNIGWMILAEWPIEDVDAVIRVVRDQITTFTFLSLLAVLILVPFFAGRIIGPIRKLEEGADEIEKGNFDKIVEIKTEDELEELGEKFNHMAKGLKRLQELKNEFVFIAAHELRSPVTAIKGYLSMVFEEGPDAVSETARKYLTTVQKANDRLVQLVNDLLEIARSEAGRIEIKVSEGDIGEVINTILAEIKPLAEEKQIVVSYTQLEALPKLRMDISRAKEIAMNLISNAIKYNNVGGWIKVYHEMSGPMVVTHVEDNGFGMSEEDQKHMFEKFYRSPTGKEKSIQGTGLGLFITRELVEKMGGKIWLKSEEGKGTRFSFSLPII